jgi:protein tyrosine phosphatase (PTP) superfamily phosphohydrolase (DUF442 family)
MRVQHTAVLERRKKMIQQLLLVSALFVTATVQALDSPVPPTKPLQVTETVTLAGLLPDAMIPSLQEEDVLVIDLRTPDEGIQTEVDLLSAENVEYVNIPVGRSPLERATVDRFSQLINGNFERKILVHCSSGNRAGILWAAYLIDKGVPVIDAVDKVLPVVTKEPAHQAILDYAQLE